MPFLLTFAYQILKIMLNQSLGRALVVVFFFTAGFEWENLLLRCFLRTVMVIQEVHLQKTEQACLHVPRLLSDRQRCAPCSKDSPSPGTVP